MSDEKDSREDKLPQWARRELDRLRSDVEYHQKQLRTLVERPEGGVIVRDPYGDAIPVAGEREILRVALPNRNYVDIRWMDGYLEVSTFESLAVQPVSSNLIRLRPTTWTGVPTL